MIRIQVVSAIALGALIAGGYQYIRAERLSRSLSALELRRVTELADAQSLAFTRTREWNSQRKALDDQHQLEIDARAHDYRVLMDRDRALVERMRQQASAHKSTSDFAPASPSAPSETRVLQTQLPESDFERALFQRRELARAFDELNSWADYCETLR